MPTQRHTANKTAEPPRQNAEKLFLGTEPFVDDAPRQGDWLGGTVRSKVAHGRLRQLKFDKSFDWSRVVVVTPEDIPGANEVVCLEQDQPSLCHGTIRHVGEPIALVAAPDKTTLQLAMAAIEPVVESLPAVFDPFESLKCEVPIFGPSNLFLDIPIRKGDPAEALRRSDVVVETFSHTPAQEHAYLETQGMRAIIDDAGRVRIEGSIQCPFSVVEGVARLLGVEESDVRVIVRQTGGGFGGKEDFPTMLAGHAALLARKCGRPVRMIYDRVEDMAATTKRHPAWILRKTGSTSAGVIQAIDVDLVIDGGAYATLSPFVLSRAALHAIGPYRCDNVVVRARAVATHHPPNGGFRGFGCPQVHFATETHMDTCAETLGIDPVEFRRRNAMRPGDSMPFGQILGTNTNFEALLAGAIERTDFQRRRAEIASFVPTRNNSPGTSPHTRRGIGLSLFMHGTGLNGHWERAAHSRVRLEATCDGQIQVLTAQTEFGQGTLTAIARITARAVGIDEADVLVDHPDTALVPNSGPTVASRTVSIVGDLIRDAGVELRARVLETAGLDGTEDAVSLKAAIARCVAAGHDLTCEAVYAGPDEPSVRDRWVPQSAYPEYAGGCCVAEVEVDQLTGHVAVKRLDMVCDIGEVISRKMATSQVIGGAAQGIGWALTEEVFRNEQGGMLNARLSDYAIPSAADIPEVRVAFLEPDEAGELRHSKGLGELPMEGPGPAIANAVAMATGYRPDRLPIRLEPMPVSEIGPER